MNNEVLNPATGEIETLAQPLKFRTNFKQVPPLDSEKNSGEYIVDDRDYVSLPELIQRTRRENPRRYWEIVNGSEMDSVLLHDADEVRDYITNAETDAEDYRPSDDEAGNGGEPTPSGQGEPDPNSGAPDAGETPAQP
uniref:Uncharacterized protein n=1 Tax=Dulem virus 94 TaxID=3145805 RepID=A0AAU8AY06_9VIRU